MTAHTENISDDVEKMKKSISPHRINFAVLLHAVFVWWLILGIQFERELLITVSQVLEVHYVSLVVDFKLNRLLGWGWLTWNRPLYSVLSISCVWYFQVHVGLNLIHCITFKIKIKTSFFSIYCILFLIYSLYLLEYSWRSIGSCEIYRILLHSV